MLHLAGKLIMINGLIGYGIMNKSAILKKKDPGKPDKTLYWLDSRTIS
jgi:hypothetical protein